MNKCGEIFNECENAIGVALNTLYTTRPGRFLLYLARGEYNPVFENSSFTTPYLLDYRLDIYNNHYQQEFIIHYLNRNYKKDGFEYANEIDVDDMITEMLIYSHVWEDVGFLKLLVRLAGLLNNEDYLWKTDLEYHNELYIIIQTKVIQPLQKQKLGLGDLIQSAYSSHIRDAFAHSMYSIDYDSRKIRLWGGRREDKKWEQELTFEEFQVKFLKTIRIWNQLYHLCDECRKLAATQNLTGEVPLQDGRKLRIRAEWIERGGVPEPYFKGIVIKRAMKILVVSRYKAKIAGHVLPFVAEQTASLKDAGCEVELFLLKGNYFKQWKSLRTKIREWKPDVIHAHYGLSCLLANLATRRVPVVSTYHGSDINEPKVLPFSKVAMWLSAWNIFVSKRNVDIAQPRKHWSLVPCGINLPQPWSELQKQKVEQLTLNQWIEGELEKGKKHVLFAGAFDNRVKDSELAKASVALLGNVQLIELRGYNRDQVNALMYFCDAFLMTSKTEGSPQVIKEAMACGCPIVSVDVGDVAERINGVAGCYVVPSREPKEIAEILEKALAFEGRTKGCECIIEAGLTNEQVVKRIVEIYENIVR